MPASTADAHAEMETRFPQIALEPDMLELTHRLKLGVLKLMGPGNVTLARFARLFGQEREELGGVGTACLFLTTIHTCTISETLIYPNQCLKEIEMLMMAIQEQTYRLVFRCSRERRR